MKYEEITIGERRELTHTITQEDITKFVELTGDDNRLHVDAEYAAKTPFKKQVVHGMLGASFISTIIGTKIPGDGALWFSQSLEFLLPVRIGDKITVIAEVVKKNDKEKIIELKTDILNQNRQTVTRGYAKVKLIEQEEKAVIEEPTNKPRAALVVGATGGIGQETCLALAQEGFNIAIHYNSNKKVAEHIKSKIEEIGQKAIIVQGDITNEKQVADLIERCNRTFGTIDTLVNCAATTIPNIKIEDLQWEDFVKQMDLNIKSILILTKGLLPQMAESKYGKIITIGSYAFEKPNTEWAHYITAKGALVGLTRALAMELAPKGIRVNMVTPSLVNTDLTADIPMKFKLLTAAQTPLRRLAESRDVASAIAFLASDKSDFLSGENIRLNGGQIMI